MKTDLILHSLTICVILSSLTACANHKTAQSSSLNHASTQASPSAMSSPAKSQETPKGTKINVTAKEMLFQLSSPTAPAGLVEFVVKNEGKKPHEFVVLKNDLLDKKLPLKGGSLDEDAKGLKNLGEINESKLTSGTTQTLQLNLTPGRYLLVCNLPGHFQAGMKTEFTVK
jgi:uncharacterized cupredoxin-like copper-binding protein